MPTLPDELLEEIFLRLPPDEPEWLVRASLASKLWLGRLTEPRFHARYSDFHRAAPMLGFFQYCPPFVSVDPLFVSTTKFPVCIPNPPAKTGSYGALDCRHGRVLLVRRDVSPEKLVVLDPITGCRTELDTPDFYSYFGATVLCAVDGCDHRACHAGPSRVVFVTLDDDDAACVYEYLPDTGGERSKPHSHLRHWSKQCSDLHLGPDAQIGLLPPVIIQDKLYFKVIIDDDRMEILKYDLSSKCLSLTDRPLAADFYGTILMGMEDGSLGFARQTIGMEDDSLGFARARLDRLTLNLWSRQMGADGVGSWSECRVIHLKELLPAPNKRLRLIGSVDDGDIIFVTTELGTYEINLKSLEWKKIWKEECYRTLIPCMSFYYPQGRAKPCDAGALTEFS